MIAGHPIEWQDKDGKPVTLYMGNLSADRKRAFADWTKVRALAAAKKILSGEEYLQFRQEVVGVDVDDDDESGNKTPSGGIYWTAVPSMAVVQALKSKAGQIYLNRLLYGESVAKWPDADLWAFLKAKDRKLPTADDPDPVQSDHAIAFDLVWETQDPKAPAPSSGTGGQADTTS